ncbi:formate dehydrogenase accessory sulfurtransferase FdhD [Pontibacillus yanchengensis]|uniref:Formate dehydrogenase accessory sulfurtransferase FdhD n=2 Tax=Pontibacillus yanchengensis TaxID=462910 RepID=A0ACC7VCB2_9BACI|nr:formate dehydrogenase accessory sulfurtransferase FdhD [Pontibacillus yanchengensis]MYL34705.1 formate dehydrogenase accessory sulfurtransferase FdhD [Pontibacillus yanchengensis]MYL52310.1 formate dehydrogenase accessory sulfurtransferase FdhD [Pontibacillus yanchengensis]
MGENIVDSWNIQKYHRGTYMEIEDEIAIEFALTVVIQGEEYATMICSPSALEELVIGFLASEALIRSYEDIQYIQLDSESGFAYVELFTDLPERSYGRTKRFIGSCCGKSREFYFDQDVKTAKTIMKKHVLSVQQVFTLMDTFQQHSEDFKRTGGVHQAALANRNELLYKAVDIGRHNALDKVYGYLLKNQISRREKQIVFSGRISSEVLVKVSKIGIGTLLSPSAPTDLALRLAEDLNITTVGFIRQNRLNVYTGQSYIQEEPPLIDIR